MKTLPSTLKALVLALLLLMAVAAQAAFAHAEVWQDGDQAGEGNAMVTKTFQLTLYGEVPPGEMFSLTGTGINASLFCGEEVVGGEPCQGNGTVYTASVDYPAGTTITFRFIRNENDPGAREVFQQGTETLISNMTNTASYTYSEAPAELPATGAEGSPAGILAAALSLLAAGSYVVRRQR